MTTRKKLRWPILLLSLCLLAAPLSGCMTYKKYEEPEWLVFRQEILEEYPDVGHISIQKGSDGNLHMELLIWNLSSAQETQVLQIIGKMRELAMREEVQNKLKGTNPLGYEPNIYADFYCGFSVLGLPFRFDRGGFYRFESFYTDPAAADYTVDGYSTWWGNYKEVRLGEDGEPHGHRIKSYSTQDILAAQASTGNKGCAPASLLMADKGATKT